MSERLSMWTQSQLSRWLATAVCPNQPTCDETNVKHRQHLIELNENGCAYCNACGHMWDAPRPTVTPISE